MGLSVAALEAGRRLSGTNDSSRLKTVRVGTGSASAMSASTSRDNIGARRDSMAFSMASKPQSLRLELRASRWLRRTPASSRSWSLMATTPLTTSTPSRVSRVFSTADRNDAAVRSTTRRSSAHRIEGLVRDNRVEVRVLFGALRKAPHGGAFAFSGFSMTVARAGSGHQAASGCGVPDGDVDGLLGRQGGSLPVQLVPARVTATVDTGDQSSSSLRHTSSSSADSPPA